VLKAFCRFIFTFLSLEGDHFLNYVFSTYSCFKFAAPRNFSHGNSNEESNEKI
jgi:hypothetical protein